MCVFIWSVCRYILIYVLKNTITITGKTLTLLKWMNKQITFKLLYLTVVFISKLLLQVFITYINYIFHIINISILIFNYFIYLYHECRHPVYTMSMKGVGTACELITVSTDGMICQWDIARLNEPTNISMLATPYMGLVSECGRFVLLKYIYIFSCYLFFWFFYTFSPFFFPFPFFFLSFLSPGEFFYKFLSHFSLLFLLQLLVIKSIQHYHA